MHGIIFHVTQNPFLSRPLGGHRIAHFLREKGWDIEVVDWANWWTLEQLQSLFRSRYSDRTKFIAFSHLFSMWSPGLEEFGAWVKQEYPHVSLISGSGVNPMFESKVIDYYTQGYGEFAIEALLKYIVGNGPLPIFNLNAPKGLKMINAIHSYPAFPMQDLMVKYEDRDFVQPNEWLTIETSRGCMFSCAFCNFPVLGVRTDHTRNEDNFGLQLKDTYDRFGVTNYILADETFNDSVEKTRKFANVVQGLDFDTWFSGYVRADLMIARDEDREELLRMNLLGHYYGIESFNTKSAKSIGKGMDSERIKQGLLDSRKYFETHGSGRYRGSMGLIAGLPYETEDSLYRTLDWLIHNWQGHSFSMHGLMIPSRNPINIDSKMSLNLEKYGYDPMTDEEIATWGSKESGIRSNKFSNIIPQHYRKPMDELVWKNDIMTWFDAQRIGAEITKIKGQHDFRPSCHALSYKLTQDQSVDQRLKLDFDQFDPQLDFDIQPYINKKLSLGV
jgi:hypothetical protein